MELDYSRLQQVLAARARLRVSLPGFREAAVLVALVTESPGPPTESPHLVLIERRADLRAHAGQIAFPGGGREPADRDAPATAVREAEEELGIPQEAVEILGLLDDVPTPSRFVITPVIARVTGPLALRPSPVEVADVFTVTLDDIQQPGCYRDGGTREFFGVRYVMHEYHCRERRIWGATARILHQLLELLSHEPNTHG